MSIPNQLAPLLGSVPAGALLLFTLIVSLLLIFAGRKVVKILAFFVVGVVGASLGATLVSQYFAGSGSLGALLGVLGGFLIGGVIGILLVAVGVGVAMGYAAYLFTTGFVSGTTIPLVVGFVFFIIGVVLYNKILGVVTALAGGFLFYDVLLMYGIDPLLSTIVAVVLTIAGIWVQEGFHRRVAPPVAPAAPASP
ncbi:MAG TPA: hypothetical protein VEJ19_08870 [Nitrososphaerales archaeon]|nr:hypothetical protein [Nitrososphaerales archaeon]